MQQLSSKKDSFNIFTIIRSNRGYGNECNIFTFPINYKASVTAGVTYAETLIRRQPKWLAKDLIILFYDANLDYSMAVREFLENYHY